jgi:hypothetical protein
LNIILLHLFPYRLYTASASECITTCPEKCQRRPAALQPRPDGLYPRSRRRRLHSSPPSRSITPRSPPGASGHVQQRTIVRHARAYKREGSRQCQCDSCAARHGTCVCNVAWAGAGRGELDPCPPYHWSETKTYVREHLIHNHVRMLDPISGELAIFPASCWSNLLVKHAWRLFRAVPLHRLESILCSIRVQCVCVACKIQRHSSAAQIGQPQPVE